MAIRDPAYRMPENLDRRLGQVFVVAQVFQQPRGILPRLNVSLGFMPPSWQSAAMRTLGRAPPPRNTGSSGAGSAGIKLFMFMWA
jgi:hypothetical protein